MKKALPVLVLLCACIIFCSALSACDGHSHQDTQESTEAETEFICTDHQYGEWYVQKYPNCTEDGFRKADCIYCDEYKTEPIPMAHSLYTQSGKEPTCKEIGWKEYQSCSYCNYTTYEELPKAHKADENGVCVFCEYTLISTAEDLKKIELDGKYLLLEDIDLGGAEWTPVGTDDAPFTGEFNGNGHTVKNYKITVYREYIGFFGAISGYAKIYGLGVEEFNIDVSGSSVGLMAGGLIGCSTGESIHIESCHASGEMNITASVGDDDNNGYNSAYVGGLIGYTQGSASVYYCYSDVEISANTDKYAALFIGGLSGHYHDWRISECYSSSNVSAITTDTAIYIGGLLGSSSGAQQHKIQNCYTTGSVYALSNSGDINAGGVVGRGAALYCYSTCPVNASSVSGEVLAGGIVGGTSTFLTVSNCLATGRVISSGYAGGAAGMKDFTPGDDGYISSCYYIEPNSDHIQGDRCDVGHKATVEQIKSAEFFTSSSYLGFYEDVWHIADGELPTLHCFEILIPEK